MARAIFTEVGGTCKVDSRGYISHNSQHFVTKFCNIANFITSGTFREFLFFGLDNILVCTANCLLNRTKLK